MRGPSRVPLLLLLLAAAPAPDQPGPPPVRGPSWLQHLGLAVEETHLGRMGGAGPPPATLHEPMPRLEGRTTQPFTLTGQDLYRLNCRSCHGPDGRGAPPEIHSLLDPVRATSASVIATRQRDQGRRLPAGMAEQLAADARRALRDRIANGGQKMPAFPQLSAGEVHALVSYLDVLAGIPGAARSPPTVTASADQVGEQLVKGTCHICHPATGPTPTHMSMYMRGIPPPLASLPERWSPSGVLGKVREGRMASMRGGRMGGGMMGGRMMGGRGMGHMGRMPVFGYLTDEEVTAAYLFLSDVPPRPEPPNAARRPRAP